MFSIGKELDKLRAAVGPDADISMDAQGGELILALTVPTSAGLLGNCMSVHYSELVHDSKILERRFSAAQRAIKIGWEKYL